MAGNSFSKSVKKSKSSKQLIVGSGDGSKDSSNDILKSISSLLRELTVGSHERAASDVNVSLKTIAGNSVSIDPRYREYDLAHLKLMFEFSIYKVWKSVGYGVFMYWIWRIGDFLEHGNAISSLMDTAYWSPEHKIWYDEDVHDLRSVETEFPTIAFNDQISSEKTLSCEPTVSSLNDEIDFKISFDDSNDEDYTVIFDKNLFSYKIISTNDLKTDSENDNEKVNMPSLPPPEPTVSCFDDLDFFKDFENEFPAIVYNDARTSKSDLLTEPILSPQHIDEIDLNKETSLSEYNEEEHNVL
ncbi:hypothetical protein Tco_0140810 [Tanacetum coccineum]